MPRLALLDVFLFMPISRLMKRFARSLGLIQQFVELVVADGEHFHDHSSPQARMDALLLAVVEELHLAEVFARSEFQRNHIGLILARQDHFHRAFGNDVERIAVFAFRKDHCARIVMARFEFVCGCQ